MRYVYIKTIPRTIGVHHCALVFKQTRHSVAKLDSVPNGFVHFTNAVLATMKEALLLLPLQFSAVPAEHRSEAVQVGSEPFKSTLSSYVVLHIAGCIV